MGGINPCLGIPLLWGGWIGIGILGASRKWSSWSIGFLLGFWGTAVYQVNSWVRPGAVIQIPSLGAILFSLFGVTLISGLIFTGIVASVRWIYGKSRAKNKL